MDNNILNTVHRSRYSLRSESAGTLNAPTAGYIPDPIVWNISYSVVLVY